MKIAVSCIMFTGIEFLFTKLVKGKKTRQLSVSERKPHAIFDLKRGTRAAKHLEGGI